jgi:short-subunit dehydrogenase
MFGLGRLTQLVLPAMREKRFGKIVNISSMGGKIYTPLGGWYHATKHALEGFSDCLRIETKPFGIDVIVIEPGGIQSEWGDIAAQNVIETSGAGAYRQMAQRTAKTMKDSYHSGKVSPASVIAAVIIKAVTARRPKTRYAAGYMAKPTLFLRRIASDRMFDRLVTRMA